MTHGFTRRRLATLVLITTFVAVWATACGSDKTTDDEPPLIFPGVSGEVSPEPPATATEPAPRPTATVVPTVEPTAPAPIPEALAEVLETIRAATGAPALAAAIFSTDGTIIDMAAVGVRRNGDDARVTLTDGFQLGSETKAMTATLISRLAEQGLPLSLDTPLTEAFPGFTSIDEAWASVTMAQLLSHTAGIDDDFGAEDDDSGPTLEEVLAWPVQEQRAWLTEYVLGLPPAIEPGTTSHYSNIGYIVAGSALEAAAGTTWETLMRAELFEPLGMDSCGFGEPGADGSGAPWGHDASGTPTDPMLPTFDLGRLAVAGPAATVYCPMADWVKFLSELMRGLNGESDYLSQAAVERLFTTDGVPYEGDPTAEYALGWVVYDAPIGPVYTHDGSNGYWFASVFLFPEAGQGVITVSNGSGPPNGPGMQAAQTATNTLLDMYPPVS